MTIGIKTREPVYCAKCGKRIGEIDEGKETDGIYVYCKSSICQKMQPIIKKGFKINAGRKLLAN
jgi:hypothetical protein